MTRIFVYGSLMSGMGNHHVLEGATFVGKARTADASYRMVSMGGFPAVSQAESAGVAIVGEVYDVDDATLARLDRMEGHPDWYSRGAVKVVMADSTSWTRAWIYLMPATRAGAAKDVPSGDWRAHVEVKGDRFGRVAY